MSSVKKRGFNKPAAAKKGSNLGDGFSSIEHTDQIGSSPAYKEPGKSNPYHGDQQRKDHNADDANPTDMSVANGITAGELLNRDINIRVSELRELPEVPVVPGRGRSSKSYRTRLMSERAAALISFGRNFTRKNSGVERHRSTPSVHLWDTKSNLGGGEAHRSVNHESEYASWFKYDTHNASGQSSGHASGSDQNQPIPGRDDIPRSVTARPFGLPTPPQSSNNSPVPVSQLAGPAAYRAYLLGTKPLQSIETVELRQSTGPMEYPYVVTLTPPVEYMTVPQSAEPSAYPKIVPTPTPPHMADFMAFPQDSIFSPPFLEYQTGPQSVGSVRLPQFAGPEAPSQWVEPQALPPLRVPLASPPLDGLIEPCMSEDDEYNGSEISLSSSSSEETLGADESHPIFELRGEYLQIVTAAFLQQPSGSRARTSALETGTSTPNLPSSGSSGPRGGGYGSEPQSSRKHGRSSDSADSPGDKGEKIGNKVSSKRRAIARELCFACPFAKKDPIHSRDCYRFFLTRIRDVKQHLKRCHRMPIHCPRCGEVFNDEDDRDQHLRSADCSVCDLPQMQGISDKQQKQLSQRMSSRMSEEEQWFAIFDIVFPGQPHPRSPYLDRELSEQMQIFRDFLLVEGRLLLSEFLDSRGAVTWTPPPEESDLALFQERILGDGLQFVFDRFTSANSAQNPSSTSASARPGIAHYQSSDSGIGMRAGSRGITRSTDTIDDALSKATESSTPSRESLSAQNSRDADDPSPAVIEERVSSLAPIPTVEYIPTVAAELTASTTAATPPVTTDLSAELERELSDAFGYDSSSGAFW